MILLLLVFSRVAKTLEPGFAFTPLVTDFNVEVKEHRTPEKPLDLCTSVPAELFQGHPSLADDDSFLGIPFHDDIGIDVRLPPLPFLELNNIDRCRVRHFFVVQLEDRFSHEFRCKEPFGLFTYDVRRIKRRMNRDFPNKRSEEIVKIIFLLTKKVILTGIWLRFIQILEFRSNSSGIGMRLVTTYTRWLGNIQSGR